MISIIIPHKKGVPYLKDALDSIKDLTYKDYETILVIDHSEDDLDEVINKYKDITSGERLFKVPSDQKMNDGIKEAAKAAGLDRMYFGYHTVKSGNFSSFPNAIIHLLV